jgi:hypothetical protein
MNKWDAIVTMYEYTTEVRISFRQGSRRHRGNVQKREKEAAKWMGS